MHSGHDNILSKTMQTQSDIVNSIPPEWLPFIDVSLLRSTLEITIDTTIIETILNGLQYCSPLRIVATINLPNVNVQQSDDTHLLSQYIPGIDMRPLTIQGVLIFDTSLFNEWTIFSEDFLTKFYRFKSDEKQKLHCLVNTLGQLDYHDHNVHLLKDNAFFMAFPNIVWNPLSTIIAFTDGGCSKNGKVGARASYATMITGGQFGNSVVSGEVYPNAYKFIDVKNPHIGIMHDVKIQIAPSNNRGELLGIVYALLALLKGCAIGNVEIISDSKISVNTLSTWLPNRIKKGTSHEMKNLDLLMISWELLASLRKQCKSVIFTHTNSHTRQPPISAPSRERYIWKGNDMVDKYAAIPLHTVPPNYSVKVSNAIDILYSLQ